MTKNRDRGSELGCGAVRFARATAAGALLCLAQTVGGQPVPNVAAWGTFIDLYGRFSTEPPAPPASATNIVAASDSFGDALALRGDGSLVGWGFSTLGQTNIPPGLGNALAPFNPGPVT